MRASSGSFSPATQNRMCTRSKEFCQETGHGSLYECIESVMFLGFGKESDGNEPMSVPMSVAEGSSSFDKSYSQ